MAVAPARRIGDPFWWGMLETEGMMDKIQVLLADDQQRVRAGLRMLLALEPDIEVVGEAEDGETALRLAAELDPDVIVMDIRMPGIDGIAATNAIVRDCDRCAVVIHTLHDDAAMRRAALHSGACEFVSKQQGQDALVSAIRRAALGASAPPKA
jgi:DNA-binding NarL/FixJ family response regulator